MANMREIAKEAGVSISTVSSVLNGDKFVSPLLINRVRTVAEQMGYTNARSIGLRNARKQRKVGVILPGLCSSFFPQMLHGIADATAQLGWNMMLCESNRSFTKEKEIVDMLSKQGVKGIIIDSVCDDAHAPEYYGNLRKRIIGELKMQVVFLERKVEEKDICSIYVDNYKMSHQATAHLIEIGRRRIAHIGGPRIFPHSQVRAEGYKAALLEHGIPFDKQLVENGDFSPLSGYGAMQTLIGKGVVLDAVFAANDQMGIGAMKAIREAGYSIPGDIAVAGFDNLPMASLVQPGLTSVQCSTYQMGSRAVQMVHEAQTNRDLKRQIELDANLVKRRSTAEIMVDDWNLMMW